MEHNIIAVLIGVESCLDLPPVDGVQASVAALRARLSPHVDDVITLHNPTYWQLYESAGALRDRLGPDDVLIWYFTGYTASLEAADHTAFCILPHDAMLGHFRQFVPLVDWLAGIAAKHVWALVDGVQVNAPTPFETAPAASDPARPSRRLLVSAAPIQRVSADMLQAGLLPGTAFLLSALEHRSAYDPAHHHPTGERLAQAVRRQIIGVFNHQLDVQWTALPGDEAGLLFWPDGQAPAAVRASERPDLAQRLRTARAYFDAGRDDAAVAEYAAILRVDPHCTEAFAWRGRAYSRLRRYDEALADALIALELDDQLSVAYNTVGYVYWFRDKDYKRAEGEFTRALALGDHPDPHFPPLNRGKVREKMDDLEGANADFRLCLSIISAFTGQQAENAKTTISDLEKRIQKNEEKMQEAAR